MKLFGWRRHRRPARRRYERRTPEQLARLAYLRRQRYVREQICKMARASPDRGKSIIAQLMEIDLPPEPNPLQEEIDAFRAVLKKKAEELLAKPGFMEDYARRRALGNRLSRRHRDRGGQSPG